MIRSFSDGIFNVKIELDETDKKQTNLLNRVLEFNDKSRPNYKAVRRKAIIFVMTVKMLPMREET